MYIARYYEQKVQTLYEHLYNVAGICKEYGKNIGLYYTAMLAGILHDMGKYSEDFQNYIKKAKNKETYSEEKVDHGVYGGKYLFEKFSDAKGPKQISRDIICEVITYHHGGLPDNVNYNDKNPMIERFKKISDEQMKEVCDRYFYENKCVDINYIFEKSSKEIDKIYFKMNERSFEIGLVIKTLYSILVDADRLDSYLFTLEDKPDIEFDSEKIFDKYAKVFEDKILNLSQSECLCERTKELNKYRNLISQKCKDFSKAPTGIYTLTVPTGGGKTFASLRFALNHGKKRIFYIMPYTTIVEQNAQAVREILDCEDDVLEYHSNIVESKKIGDYELISERFDYPIVFTTMVQFLNSFFAKGNSNIRRLHNFDNSVIIFDEIQTLPIKCMSIFYKTLVYLKNVMNTTSILCTATQPDFSFIQERLNITLDGEIIDSVDYIYQNLERMNVLDKTQEKMTCEDLSNFAVDIKENISSLLIVMNTVSSANKVYDFIKEKIDSKTEIILLTSRLCPAHRKVIIEEIKKKLKQGENIICVSTQLIEAGVDISFSSVIRSLSGLDSIAQAAGRGNRNAENEKGNVYIVNVIEENISMLKEIEIGQNHTQDLLWYFSKNSKKYDNSLLSPKSIKSYYEFYFSDNEINKNMDYIIDDSEKTILNLLKNNKARISNYSGIYPLCFMQQFVKAADYFQVIDSLTHSVIVEWDEQSKKHIGILLSNENLSEKNKALKELQRSTVNIYDNLYKKLLEENAFIPCENENINILKQKYYNKERGITLEGKNKLEMY